MRAFSPNSYARLQSLVPNIATLGLLSACGAPAGMGEPAVPPPQQAAPAEAPVSAVEPAEPTPSESAAASEVCPLFATLFKKGRSFDYSVQDETDGHGPEDAAAGPPDTVAVSCKIQESSIAEGHLHAELLCANDSLMPMVEGFSYSEGKLWWGPVGDEEAPLMSCTPEAGKSERAGPEFMGQPSQCTTETKEDPKLGWCRTERCTGGGYGGSPSVVEICLSAANGVTRYHMENVEAPRVVTWHLSPAAK